VEPTIAQDAELATLYGGLGGMEMPYPLLIEPWEGESWDQDSGLDAEIFASLISLSP
jgi:hypothetical protein